MINQVGKTTYVNTKSFKFSKTPSGNSFLISALAVAIGIAVTFILVTARAVSMVFAGETAEEDLS